MPRLDAFDKTLAIVQSWSCEDQYDFAQQVAANVGYNLAKDNHEVPGLSLADRVERLEEAVRELNPGLNL